MCHPCAVHHLCISVRGSMAGPTYAMLLLELSNPACGESISRSAASEVPKSALPNDAGRGAFPAPDKLGTQ
jgi:hypothetical protein